MNRMLAEAVAARGPDARLVDLSAIVCPGGHFTSELDGVPLRLDDGVHFDVRVRRWCGRRCSRMCSTPRKNRSARIVGWRDSR